MGFNSGFKGLNGLRAAILAVWQQKVIPILSVCL